MRMAAADGPAVRDLPSPNWDDRPPGTSVDTLILHYTGMPTAAAALDRLRDPASRVSSHYVVDEDGTVWRLVDERRRAWHAGVSHTTPGSLLLQGGFVDQLLGPAARVRADASPRRPRLSCTMPRS